MFFAWLAKPTEALVTEDERPALSEGAFDVPSGERDARGQPEAAKRRPDNLAQTRVQPGIAAHA